MAILAGGRWAVHQLAEVVKTELRGQLDPAVLRPTQEEADALKKENKPIPPTIDERFAQQKEAVGEVKKAVEAPNSPQSELGHKLDTLDKTLRERLPARPNKPPMPPVGPTAKQEGFQ